MTTKTKSLTSLIKDLKFDYVDSDITEADFPLNPIRSTDYKLFQFDRHIESEDAVKEMEKEGYSPATLSELLAFAKDDWNDEDWVVALGSVAGVGLSRRVPYLDGGRTYRELDLAWWGCQWRRYYRFLAVRKSSDLKNSALPLHPLNLTLEKRVAELEAWRERISRVLKGVDNQP